MTFFVSCSSDDNNNNDTRDGSTIVAEDIENAPSNVETVRANAYSEEASGEIAKAPFADAGFVMDLPDNPPAAYMTSVSQIKEDMEEDGGELNTTDPNLNIVYLEDIVGYDQEDKELGYFFLYSYNENKDIEYYTSWVYADRKAKMEGSVEDEYGDDIEVSIIDLDLKKGWNLVYEIYEEEYDEENDSWNAEIRTTTTRPSSVDFGWMYYSIYDRPSTKKNNPFSVLK